MEKKLEEISQECITNRLKVTTKQLKLMGQVKADAERLKGKSLMDKRVYNAMIQGYQSEIENLTATKAAYEIVLRELTKR